MNRDVSQRIFWRLTLGVLVATAALGALVSAARRGPSVDAAAVLPGHASDAALDGLRRYLAAIGLEVRVENGAPSIAWNDFSLERHALGDYLRPRTFTFTAQKAGEKAPDVYRGHARVTADGVPIEVTDVVNLTRTEHGEELGLVVRGPYVAFLNRIEGGLRQVMLLDYRGEAELGERTLLDRFMDAVANWQSVKDSRGVERRIYEFNRSPAAAVLRFEGEGDAAKVVVATGGQDIASIVASSGDLTDLLGGLPTSASAPPPTPTPAPEGAPSAAGSASSANTANSSDKTIGPIRLGAVAPTPRPKRMFIDWVANTVRRVIGEERFEWVKIYALGLKDKWKRLSAALFGEAAPEADELEAVPVVAAHAQVKKLNIQFGQDPNWPPPPLEPMLSSPKLKGEGQWVDIYDFDLRNGGAPPALLKTVLRPDPKRPHAAVRIVLIDPRQVDLHIVAGTRHPESTTGQLGEGIIPRDKETMSRLLGAFNGGFKTMHGAYGMMVKGKVIVPAKNGAATIARMKDGRIALGTWDAPNGAPLPGAMAYRQNLPPLVEASVVNPTGMKKWGNTVQNLDSDGKHTYRSAVGLTQYGHLMYVWGDDLSHETLGLAMVRAGCIYAVHLDMNHGHSRFEFYRAFEEQTLGKARPDRKMYSEGPIKYQAKKLSNAQISWLFPRYIKRDIRDFFYLTLRHVFPYEEESTLAWSVDGLPEELREWPPLVVRAKAKVGAAEVLVFKLDAQRMHTRLRLGGRDGATAGAAAREIDRADVPRMAAVLGLGTALGGPLRPQVRRRLGASPSPAGASPATPALPSGLDAADAGPAAVVPPAGSGRLALFVDKKGRVRIEKPARVQDAPWSVRPGVALVQGGKVLPEVAGLPTGPLAWRGALGVDARGDLFYALAQTTELAPLARALADAGAQRALVLGQAGEDAFLRVFTPGEREGEIVATSLHDDSREALRSMPLGYDQSFLYVLPEAPPPRVVSLESVRGGPKTAERTDPEGSNEGPTPVVTARRTAQKSVRAP